MKKAAIIILVLIGLLVAVDFGTAAAAEYQVSKRLRGHLGLPDDPAVRINGFPFFVQAIAGDYRNVEVTADRVTVASVRNVGVEATLHHIRVPLSDLLSGSVDSVRVDEVVGRARIQVSELGKVIEVDDLRVEPVPAEDQPTTTQPAVPDADGIGTVKLTGTTEVIGQRAEVTVIGSLDLVGGQIQVTAHDVEVAGGSIQQLPPAVKQSLLRAFTARLDPGALPFTVTPTSIRLEEDTLVVEGNAQNVELTTGASP